MIIRNISWGNPVPDVTVYLQQNQSGSWQTVAQAITNEDGYFEFTNIPAGEYRVVLDIPGLDMNNVSIIDVGDGETVEGVDYTVTDQGINTTGVNEISVQNLKIYPNPVKDELQVTSYKLQDGALYSIFSVTGQVLMQGKLQGETTTINVSTLPSGVYFIKVGNMVGKIVKN